MTLTLAQATRSRLYRLAYIDKMIVARRYPNARSLAEDLGVSKRTISRDVEFLKDSLNAPLEYDARRRGFYYTEAGYSIGLLKLTEGELLALYLSHNLLRKCKGTPYGPSVLSAFQKICSYLQESVNIDFGLLSAAVDFDLEPLRGEEKKVAAHFAAIGEAIQKKETLKLLHYSIKRDSWCERLVDPYQLRYFRGAWYLVGYCHLRRAVRIFALDRIRELHRTASTYTLPDSFNPGDYLQDAFQMFKGVAIYRVKIHFSPAQARWIREKQWHPSQQIAENPDGSLVLIMHTSGLDQVKRWVLSFGAQARVLEPPELIAAVREELAAARNIYK